MLLKAPTRSALRAPLGPAIPSFGEEAGGGGGAFVALARAIDAPAGNFYKAGTARWAPADGNSLTIVSFFRPTLTENHGIFLEDTFTTVDRVRLNQTSWKLSPSAAQNTLHVVLKDPGGTVRVAHTSLGFGVHGFALGDWLPMLFSIRLDATPVLQWYAGHSNITGSPSLVSATLDLNDGLHPQIGVSNSSASNVFDISSTWIHDTYIDFSQEANRDIFMDEFGKPKYLGDTGEIPTGVQARHYAPHGNLAEHLGSEAPWVEQGEVPQVAGP